MNLFKNLRKKPAAVARPIIGITDAEYNRIIDALVAAWQEAHDRQKPDARVPSGYMKGLNQAIKIVRTVEPHIMEEN